MHIRHFLRVGEKENIGTMTFSMYDDLVKKLGSTFNEYAIISVTDKYGKITYANDNFCKMTKYTPDELLGQNHRIIKSNFHPDSFFKEMWQTIAKGKTWYGVMKNKTKDDKHFWAKTIIKPILDFNGTAIEYIAISIDITELEATKQELEKTNFQKNRFVSMVAHDLGNLLTPIQLNTKMLLKSNTDKSQTDTLREIYDASKKLNALLSDLIDTHKLDMNKINFRVIDINVNDFLKSIFNGHTIMMQEKQIHLIVDAPKQEIHINSDPDRLSQIFTNLIKNSIDFVPVKNGKITIGVKDQDKFVIFYLSDNGIGVAPEQQEALFNDFYQIDESNIGKHTGLGLGLSICKELAKRLGGRMWVESKQDVGTSFYFSIPKEIS